MKLDCPYCGDAAVTRLQKAVIMFRPAKCRACGRPVGVSMLVALAYVPSLVALVIGFSFDFYHPSLFLVAFVAALVIALVVEALTPLRPLDENA